MVMLPANLSTRGAQGPMEDLVTRQRTKTKLRPPESFPAGVQDGFTGCSFFGMIMEMEVSMAKKIITKEQIFETGVRLAQSMPPGTLTVAAVCSEMGIVKSTFYRHYRSLKDLLSDVLYQDSEQTLKKIPEIVLEDSTNVEKIERLWDIATTKIVAYGPRVLGYILQYGEKNADEKHFYLQEPFMGTVKLLIRRAQCEGEIMNMNDPDALFFAIHTYFTGNNLGWAMGDGAFDYKEYLLLGIRGILGVSMKKDHALWESFYGSFPRA